MRGRDTIGRGTRTLKAFVGMLVLFGLFVLGAQRLLSSGPFDGLFGDPVAEMDLFVDDDDSPYEDAIEELAESGVTSGCGPAADRTFCPDDVVSRAEFALFLDRVLDVPDGDMDFDDVTGDGVAAGAVGRLAAAGIVQGCSDTSFCPGDAVTRGQAAVFLDRALGLPAASEATPFEDVPADGPFAGPVARLESAGLIAPCAIDPPGYCPDRAITRAEVADLLVRADLVG